jgi:transcription termination/antitermination protein NusA
MIKARVIDVADDHYRLDIGKDLTTLLPKKKHLPKDNFM